MRRKILSGILSIAMVCTSLGTQIYAFGNDEVVTDSTLIQEEQMAETTEQSTQTEQTEQTKEIKKTEQSQQLEQLEKDKKTEETEEITQDNQVEKTEELTQDKKLEDKKQLEENQEVAQPEQQEQSERSEQEQPVLDENKEEKNALEEVTMNTDIEKLPKRTKALSDLLYKAGNQYKNEDEVSVIIKINDDTMDDVYGMTTPKLNQLRTKNGLKNQIHYAKETQKLCLKAMDKLALDYDVTETYETVLNGMALTTTFEQAKIMARMPEVDYVELNQVIPAPKVAKVKQYYTKDAYSNVMVEADKAWTKNYKGEGQLIAIIDSGADPYGEIFTDVNSSTAKIKDENQMNQLIQDQELAKGKYFSSKIPFGFNYATRDTKIKEERDESHGMHVAGIIAANSDDLKGVAPEAQLAIMRVFGGGMFGGGTTPEIYNKAIDDAVKMGVDSINMSLGSTNTTDSRFEETTKIALENAQKAGIVVAIAAGNDGFMGFGILDGPNANNPNYGLINSPSVGEVSISVASVDNTNILEKSMLLKDGNNAVNKNIIYISTDDKAVPSEYLPFVEVGKGYDENYTKDNDDNYLVKDKYALIQRGNDDGKGDFTFYEKVKIAQGKGAVGAIVYNNVEESAPMQMAGLDKDDIKIPSFFITKESGDYLIDHSNYTIKVSLTEQVIANPTGYGLSSFSSWGITEEGNLKPDLAAPGGKIYSSINNNKYKVMSGTSMATPHVTGGIAIVKQYVEKKFPNVTGTAKHQLIKNLLMSTATPHNFKENEELYGSPRGQGAGLMSLNRATQSEVVVLGTNDISSINLRNITGDKVTVTGKLKNYGDSPKTYKYYGVLNTDTEKNGYITLEPKNLINTKDNKKTITVGANSEEPFELIFDLNSISVELAEVSNDMPKGFFLEGYVFFRAVANAQSQNNPNLTDINIPFVGFKGQWENLAVVEADICDFIADGKRPMYYEFADRITTPYTHLATRVNTDIEVLGELEGSTFENPKFNKDKIAFSPNGDGSGDDVWFVGTFLRNYKDLEVLVYDKKDLNYTHPIYVSKEEGAFGMKNFFSASPFAGPNLTTTENYWHWDGKKSNGEELEEDNYVMRISVKPDGKNTNAQYMDYDILLDKTFPRIQKSSYDENSRIYTLEKVIENGAGIKKAVVTYPAIDEEGNDTVKEIEMVEANGIFGKFTIPAGVDVNNAKIEISDYAYNTLTLPLMKAIKTGTERMIIIKPVLESGNIGLDKFKYDVLDQNLDPVDEYNLQPGNYIVRIYDIDEDYVLEGNNDISVTIGQDDYDKIVNVNFKRKGKGKGTVIVSNDLNASLRLFIVNKVTGEEFELSPYFGSANGAYEIFVEPGNFKIVVRELDNEKFFVTGDESIKIDKNSVGTGESLKAIIVSKKKRKTYKLEIDRNGYQGKFTLNLIGRDFNRTTEVVEFSADESEKTLELLNKFPYSVYTSNYENAGFGTHEVNHEFKYGSKTLSLKLEKGIVSDEMMVDKELLRIYVKQAENLDEHQYELSTWEVLEVALYNGQVGLNNKNISQQEINELATALKKAIDDLVKETYGASKADLKIKIDEAQEIYNKLDDTYTERSKEFLGAAIEGAMMTYESKDPAHNTEKHIRDTINMLDRAIKNLKKVGGVLDFSELNYLIAKADELLANRQLYQTEEALNDLQELNNAAKDIINDAETKKEDIDDFIELLRLKISKIQSKADRTALEREIEICKAIKLIEYKLELRKDFRLALKEAQEVLDMKLATQNQINAAYDKLNQVRMSLVRIGEEEPENGGNQGNNSSNGGSSSGGSGGSSSGGGRITTEESKKEEPKDESNLEDKSEIVKTDVVEKDGVSEVKTDEKALNKAIEKLNKNSKDSQGKELVIKAKVKSGADKVNITIPTSSVGKLAKEKNTSLKIQTGNSQISFPRDSIEEIAKAKGKALEVNTVKEDGKVTIDVKVGKQSLDNLKGGMTAVIKDGKMKQGQVLVAVHEDGTEEIITKSLVADGEAVAKLKGSVTVKVIDNKKSFEDVSDKAWYKKSVGFATSHEIFNGTSKNKFSPNETMNRAMLVTVLHRLEDKKALGTDVVFEDVVKDSYYKEAVSWAVSKDIVKGDNGKFKPKDEITREQIATILYRYMNGERVSTDKLSTFADGNNVSAWAKDGMNWAIDKKIFKGSNNKINGKGKATRAEVATLINRIVEMQIAN